MASGQDRRAGLHRLEPRGRRSSSSSTRKPHRLRCVLGLEAKNPAIVLPDADLDARGRASACSARSPSTASAARRSRSSSSTESVADAFLRAARPPPSTALRVGMPWDDGRAAHAAARSPGKTGVPRRAASRTPCRTGARVVNAGGGDGRGTLLLPRGRLPGATPAMRLYHEEQFGPVVPVVPFDDDRRADALRRRVGLRPAGQRSSAATRRPSPADRPAGQPGLPRQPQQPVPARPRHLPVHRPQGLGRGHAVGLRRAARLLDPHPGRGQADAREHRRS